MGAFGSLWQPWVFSQTQGPCSPYPVFTPSCSPSPPGPLGPSWGLSKPWEPLEAFGSLGSSVRLRGLAPIASPTPHSLSLPLAPEPPWAPGTFLGPQEALGAFRSLGSLVGLRGLAPLAPPHSLLPPLPPEPSWASGTYLGPQEALQAFRSLWQHWLFSQTQGPCSPCSSYPLPPCSPCSPSFLSLPGPLGPSWSLRKPWEPLEAFGSIGSSVRLRVLAPPSPLLPLALPCPLGPSWAPGTLLGPQEALGAFGQPQEPWEPWKLSEPQGARGGKEE